jgi:dihydrofolate synthase/folylpolyglutamate synthase
MKSQIESIKPSFFEFTVAMAFSYFSEKKVDIAVIETGLGGRLDSTNVITPLVSLITNISMDHADMLGDNLESIAFEKAGIIKSGRPVVLGEYQPDLLNVFAAIAGERRSSLCVAELEYPVNEYTLRSGMLFVKMSHGGQEFEIESSCTYQVRNLPGVIKTVELLRLEGFRIDNSALHSGLAAFQSLTGLRGRWQLVRRNPSVVLDVAHNDGGFSRILAELQTIQYERLFIVLGMVRDKDVAALVRMLPPEAHYFFVQAGIPRALGADELNQMATSAGRAGEAIPDVNEAIRRCIALAGRSDLILVTGSNFVVAEVEPEKW